MNSVQTVSALPWSNVWCVDSTVNFSDLAAKENTEKRFIEIDKYNENIIDFPANEFTRLFNFPINNEGQSSQSTELNRLSLKGLVSSVVGLIIVIGPLNSENIDDILLIRERAPQLSVLVVPQNEGDSIPSIVAENALVWSGGLEALLSEMQSVKPKEGLHLNLKDCESFELDARCVEQIESCWTLLDARKTELSSISQETFDAFLNGQPVWGVFTAGGCYQRLLVDKLLTTETHGQKVNLTDVVLSTASELEASEFDPRNLTRQIRIFSEQGSGTTTCLRNAGVQVARAGYPVILTNPQVNNLKPEAVIDMIVHVQDEWRRGVGDRRDSRGNLPFIIFIDRDVDEQIASHLARAIGSLSRETVFIRAYERDREEIDRATDVLTLHAEVTETEAIGLGAHLRNFAQRYNLKPIPSDDEWKAYHSGLTHMLRHEIGGIGANDDVPHLLLIGIQPFIAERVRDSNTLEQYYFKHWDQIEDDNVKELVEIIAAAGVYNLSIPYDVLRRSKELDLTKLEKGGKEELRKIDLFIDWQNNGFLTKNWYLRVRHPILGRLLSRSIDPIEGDVPYRKLLPLLKELGTKEDDLWFAEALITKSAKQFKRAAPSFSLETDTPLQRAARAFFSAIPEYVRKYSRVIRHHEARYHMHVIHACLSALTSPATTTLSERQVRSVLEGEYEVARKLLEDARDIESKFEPIKNVYNTSAALFFDIADVMETPSDALEQFKEAMDMQEAAIAEDPIDAMSRYQFVHRILQSLQTQELSDDEKLKIYSRAAARYDELVHLYEERRLRNIDPIDAEIQIGKLQQEYSRALSQIPDAENKIRKFIAKEPEAGAILSCFRCLNGKSVREGFSDAKIADELRKIRDELDAVESKNSRSILFLYRLYTEDPLGRIDFDSRLRLLGELKRVSPNEYLPYWHDEAALLCQVDNLVAGSAKFRELRAFRQNARSSWYWLNERVLLEHSSPRKMTFVVSDEMNGWAHFQSTNVLIKFQTNQFPGLKKQHAFSGYVRFTLAGMQVVSQQYAEADIASMGLG